MDLPRPLFSELSALIHDLCGLALGDDKLYLVEQRLEPLVHASGCLDYKGFTGKLRGPEGLLMREAIIEAITTSETAFFRDGHPFETFRIHILPWLGQRVIQARKQGVGRPGASAGRIWCTAAATGQEPYSLAITLLDWLATKRPAALTENDFSLLATDISARVLSTAREGRYSERDVQRGLTAELRDRYFHRDGGDWVLCDRARRLVTYRRLNLVQPYIGLGLFDVIFCRNVLIYFDDDTRRQICERFWNLLMPGGLLVLGAVENLYGISTRFESIHLGETIVYRKINVVP
jgi:chemotaxis protein methyltransferase CheR